MTGFEGFGLDVRDWFRGLEANNTREYFTASRAFFDASVRGQMEALLTELAETFGGEVKLFRQNRDVRFSRDKSPYKTNTYGLVLGAAIAPDGLYASISASGLVAGSGYHMMARDQLERYREQVADDQHGPELAKLLAHAERQGLEVWGESLTTAPRGYPIEHPRIALLRRKSLALGARLPFGDRIGGAEARKFVTRTWRAAAPVTGWLDAHVGVSAERRRR
jgi:uncharacterized protein (TIGR02453 family)